MVDFSKWDRDQRENALLNWNGCIQNAAVCRQRAHLARIYREDLHVHLREAANWRRLYAYWSRKVTR